MCNHPSSCYMHISDKGLSRRDLRIESGGGGLNRKRFQSTTAIIEGASRVLGCINVSRRSASIIHSWRPSSAATFSDHHLLPRPILRHLRSTTHHSPNQACGAHNPWDAHDSRRDHDGMVDVYRPKRLLVTAMSAMPIRIITSFMIYLALAIIAVLVMAMAASVPSVPPVIAIPWELDV